MVRESRPLRYLKPSTLDPQPGISAMHIGCMFSQPDTVSALIDLGADIHALTEVNP
jgi:hypothetical protein